MKKLLLLASIFVSTSSLCAAQELTQAPQKQMPVRFLLGAAFEFGGDEVAEVYFTNGDAQSVNAGQGISIAAGAQVQFPKIEKLLFRATVGYKYVTTQADNAHIRLTRIPLQFTANWMVAEKVRVGAGLVSHQNIKFNADGLGQDITFKSATGPVFEVAYGIVGLSYTAMKYTDQSDLSYSANAIGLTLSGVFPKRN